MNELAIKKTKYLFEKDNIPIGNFKSKNPVY